ncbi:MAG: tetratricopeptide repeat protein [Pseudomonadota bacterium]|nr:tetratricopeptide repeat protein [Pseudomonadota bacterium]
MIAEHPNSLFQLAQSLESEGKLEAAAGAYRRGLQAASETGEAHHNLARLLRRLGQMEESLVHAQRAAQLLPGSSVVLNSLGQSQEREELTTDAEASYKVALDLEPGYAPAAINLGRLLERRERPDAAAKILEPVQALHPDDSSLAVNLANAYLGLGRPTEALKLLRRALGLSPDSALVLNSLGTTHYIMRNWKSAAAAFEKALSLDPEFAQVRENLAQVYFQMGNYSAGWQHYEWRWNNPDNYLTKIEFPTPEWDGAPLNGRSLLLHAEQGFGDSIQFVRFAKAINKDGGKILLACQEELVSLLNGTLELDRVSAFSDSLPHHDCHAALLSLPRLLGIAGPWPAEPHPYLSAVPHNAVPSSPGKMRIGIAWKGRPRHTMDIYRNRSCRPIDFLPLTNIGGATFYSLQTGAEAGDLDGLPLIDLAGHMTDFAASANLVQAMDFVVTVDTALAHLAGALGKACAVMVSYTSDWRWNEVDSQNPWYGSVTAFRQPIPGDWAGAFAQLIPTLETDRLAVSESS